MNVKWRDIHTTLYMTTQFETDLAGLTDALGSALMSEDPD